MTITSVAQSKPTSDSINHYYQLAMHPKTSDDLALSYNYFKKHKEECLQDNYIEGAVHDLSLLSIIQYESGFYYDSEASAVEALTLLETLEKYNYSAEAKVGLYNQLGKVSRALKENDRALRYYDKAYGLSSDPMQLNIIINNRAFVYMDDLEFGQASLEFQKAYDISLKTQDKEAIARNLDNLGYANFKLNEPDALSQLQRAMQIRVELNDIDGTYASHKHLFEYYRQHQQEQLALEHLSNAMKIADTLNSEAYRLDVLSEYINLSEDSLVKAFKSLNDKRKLENLLQENKYTSKKYDYSKKELEAQRSKAQKERYQLAGASVVIIAILTILFLRAKHKKDRIEQVVRTETRISKKIHDELANDVSNIMNAVQSDSSLPHTDKTKLLDALEDVYLRTRDISTETAGIDFENYAESLRYLLAQHNKENVKVIISAMDAIDWEKIHHHKKTAIYRTLQELMVNMKKHSSARLVTIVLKTNANGHEIHYTDDGVGCDLEKIKTHGLANAESRLKEIGAKLTFETSFGNGFKAHIHFKS